MALAAAPPVWAGPQDQASVDARVADLLARLTLEEKVSLMAGGSAFGTQPIARLGIPALSVSDGPNGVRSNAGLAATVFPTGTALAATWNPALLEEVGGAIGREALALHVQVMLGPNVNIEREPLAGRNFEAYSEDPYLAGRSGIAWVLGVQRQGVGTSVKHFVGNEQELERLRSSSNIDERALREIYLRPFEMIVQQARPWTVMVAYNRLNGTYMSENGPLIRGVLEGEWGFDGLVVSDWGAVHSTVDAARSGLDLEMPGPPRHFGGLLLQAVHDWQVDESAIDEAVRRVLRTLVRSGVLNGGAAPAGELLSSRHHAIALATAREAITLLKNEAAVLPLDPSRVHTLAVLGPNADAPLLEGGGSASVIPSRVITPLMALRAELGDRATVHYVRGADPSALPPPADARQLSPDRGRQQNGLRFSYFANADLSGKAVREGVETQFDKLFFAGGIVPFSARWEGWLWPTRAGQYQFSLSQTGRARLWLDDREILGQGLGSEVPAQFDFGSPVRLNSVTLEAGHAHRLRLEYVSAPGPTHSLHLGLRLPGGGLEEAVQAARTADAAIVFVGSSPGEETEGRDRPDMELPAGENDLVSAVLAANPRTVVVVNAGAPVAMPWAERVPAIIDSFLPGEGGAEALAQLLLGAADPSGHLPYTLPRRLQDNPAYLYYPAARDADYGEGVFVGYRYYEKHGIEPLYCFGHGLTYTQFQYAALEVPASATVGDTVPVSLSIKNVGERSGAEVVQLYVADDATRAVVRPLKELKGFEKVALAPGESRTVHFALTERDLSYYDVHAHGWVSTPGVHRVLVGRSSCDVRLERSFEWRARRTAVAGAETGR